MALGAAAQVKKAPVKKTVAKTKTTVVKKVAPATSPAGSIRVKLTTDMGVMILRLYDKTPKHRDNFVKLVNSKFFDSLLFHRVISQFMIQGGDPQSKNAPVGTMLGAGDVGYTIPAEFDTALFHKKGALAAARTDNPEKASSGCQFYIVQGKTYSDAELNMMEMQMGTKFSARQRAAYKTVGGTPFLDMNYTVFGEVEKGLEVIDKIAAVAKGMGDRPMTDVHMYAEIIK
ncbi:MAG: peptidylprolyl isomerase [Chitinophagaceae bacterium]|nr:peptidylprolyl isomerase [Chitinophagaceae bacterium]